MVIEPLLLLNVYSDTEWSAKRVSFIDVKVTAEQAVPTNFIT